MCKSELIELIYRILPYSNQIRELDIHTEEQAIRFKWRSKTYRLSTYPNVEEIGEGVLIGSDICILMNKLLKMEANSND